MSGARRAPGRSQAGAHADGGSSDVPAGRGADLTFGLMAEFATADELLAAARAARDAGYTRLEAYAPFHVEGLAEAVGFRRTKVPLVSFVGGVIGCIGGYFMQWYAAVLDYPINVGGRPLHSWPMFIPVTFELTILFGAFAAVFGMLGLNGLPMPYHPVFNVERFAAHASQDRFFLAIEATDAKFDRVQTRSFLQGLGAKEVNDVEE